MKSTASMAVVFFVAVGTALALEVFGVTALIKEELALSPAVAPATTDAERGARLGELELRVREIEVAQEAPAPAAFDAARLAMLEETLADLRLRWEEDLDALGAENLALQVDLDAMRAEVKARGTTGAPVVDLSTLAPEALAQRAAVEQIIEEREQRQRAERRAEQQQKLTVSIQERSEKMRERVPELVAKISEKVGLDAGTEQVVADVLQRQHQTLSDLQVQRVQGLIDDESFRRQAQAIRDDAQVALQGTLTQEQFTQVNQAMHKVVSQALGEDLRPPDPRERLRGALGGQNSDTPRRFRGR